MPLQFPDLHGKVAIVTGGTRGIGRECALALARQGCAVCIAAKSVTEKPNLPGTIYSVAAEVEALGASALPYRLDVRDWKSVEKCVEAVVKKYGRVDILINNASALWWHKISGTPMNKYDLITQVNARGTFAMTKACLPHMRKNKFGRIINMSPPIDMSTIGPFAAYTISKWGMTIVAMVAANNHKGKGITAHSLWPATVIESYASINFKLGTPKNWRKADILADCTLSLVGEPDSYTGKMLIDEDYLKSKGLTDAEMEQYSCVPGSKSLVYLQAKKHGFQDQEFSRGDVRKADDDFKKMKLGPKL